MNSRLIKYLFGLLLLSASAKVVMGQSALMPFHEEVYHWLDRLDIHYGLPNQMHTSIKRYYREDLANAARFVDTTVAPAVKNPQLLQWLANSNNRWIPQDSLAKKVYVDSSKIFYSYQENVSEDQGTIVYPRSRRPFLKHFYKSPAHLFEVNEDAFFLRVNPLLNFRLASVNEDDKLLFENQRGITIHGGVDEKIYFHTAILESQARYADYVNIFRQRYQAIPGAGFVKQYRSRIFDFDNGVDFLLANGYFGIHLSRHVNIELGHGRHFIGNGIRSLFLSDFSTDHFYLKLNTRVWRFHYQNIFGELTRPERSGVGDRLLPKKYFAAHYLTLKIVPNLTVGLFETVVFARENQFELQYLNPVILYRTVEGAIGSPDNVLVGIDLKWNLWQKLSLYSQFVLDEFKISEISAGDGWWANKYGLQAGIKYLDLLGVDRLDAQIEYNSVRPYTYSHNTGIANYSQYNQPLAHPLGANFKELLFRLRYQPTPKWSIILRVLSAKTGEDRDTLNFGSNVLLPNDERVSDYGNEIGQGVDVSITTVGLDLSYQWKQGFYFDVFYQARNKKSDLSNKDQDLYLGIGIRWNLGRRWLEF